ncbi:hypothetical protein [Laspinema palackyanum]
MINFYVGIYVEKGIEVWSQQWLDEVEKKRHFMTPCCAIAK